MEKQLLKIGQVLFSKSLDEYEISKIGNKYFECVNRRGRFFKDTLKFDSQFSNVTQLYTDKQHISDIIEIGKLESKIRNIMKSYGRTELSLQDLRKIDEILNKNN
jgi:hypothetical protein